MLSSRRRPISWTDLRVGLFIVSGIIVILVGIFFFHPGQRIGPSIYVRTLFASAEGLTQGAPVNMAGVQVGTVSEVDIINPETVNQALLFQIKTLKEKMDNLNVKNPAEELQYEQLKRDSADIQSRLKHIRVVMSIRKSYEDFLRSDSVATIQSQGIVKDKSIDITVGTPYGRPLSPVEGYLEIPSQEGPTFSSVVNDASRAANSLQNILAQINFNIKSNKGTLGKIVNDQKLYDNLQETLKASARATAYTGELLTSIKEGKGTIGKMFTDTSFYDSTTETIKNINNGKGTLGKLIHDPMLYNHADDLLHTMNQMTAKADKGKGTFHSLLTDASLYNNGSSAFAGISKLTESVNEGKGSLGKFANDEAFYRNASQAMSSLAQVSQDIQNGNGSLGLLIKDKKLYNNVETLIDELAQFIKDFRKNPRKYLTVQFSVIKIF